jgi:hypothetical protein
VSPELHALVVEGRRRQGLADHIEDSAVLHRVAGLLLERPGHEAGRSEAASPTSTLPHRELLERDGRAVSELGGRPVETDLEALVAPVTANGTSAVTGPSTMVSAGGDGHAASG